MPAVGKVQCRDELLRELRGGSSSAHVANAIAGAVLQWNVYLVDSILQLREPVAHSAKEEAVCRRNAVVSVAGQICVYR